MKIQKNQKIIVLFQDSQNLFIPYRLQKMNHRPSIYQQDNIFDKNFHIFLPPKLMNLHNIHQEFDSQGCNHFNTNRNFHKKCSL